ncbi:MAG TPA: outer membrane beta-barrel protein [Puia sp.]|nr:outer membrane beta-barrel protein [Puia sp.]
MNQKQLLPAFFLAFFLPTFVFASSPRDTLSFPIGDTVGGRPAPFFLVSGGADFYYRYDPARTAGNDLTSFTRSNDQFNLGMVSLRLEHQYKQVGMVADLGFGPREQEYAYPDHGIVQAIKQLYVTYGPAAWLKLTAGTWATHLCYESPDAAANRNYSMSYLFSNDPFSHTGVKAEVSSGKSGFMIGIANPCNYRSIPDSAHANKNVIAQYSYAPNDNVKLSLNYFGGRDIYDNRSHQYDLVVTAKAGNLLSLGLNASVNRSSRASEKYSFSYCWWGSALYLNLDPSPWLGITLRTEYFRDEQGVCLPAPATVSAATLSFNLKAGGLTIIPEFRVDHASKSIFTNADRTPVPTAGSFLLAAVYAF